MTLTTPLETYPSEDKLRSFEHDLQAHGTEMPPVIIAEAMSLLSDGKEVKSIVAYDPCPDDERRTKAQEWIGATRDMDSDKAHELMYSLPAMGEWRNNGSLGTGLGIYPLYNARNAKTLGEGIDVSVFHEPLFTDENGHKLSAVQVLAAEKGEETAKKKLQLHEQIINFEIDEESRIIFSGSEDSVGIRVRSQLAKEMALRAVEEHDPSKPLVLASLGAGSAIPAIESMLHLEKHGYEIGTYHFVDMDPMALATAMSLVRAHGIDENKIQLHLENLLMKKEISSIESGSVDIVDAWGLAEYFRGRQAVRLAGAAHSLLTENGSYVYGNMLTERLQKDYFKDVVQWEPKVCTRSLADGLKVLADAGLADAYVGLPSENGVYAGYAGKKSPEGLTQYVSGLKKRGKAVVALASVQ